MIIEIILEIIVRILNVGELICFVIEEAFVSIVDRVLAKNPDLEEALYRRAFDKIDRGCK